MKTISSFLALVCLLFAASVSAQFTPLNNEIRVNTTTAGNQYDYTWSVRTVAVQPDGGYIAVWVDAGGLDGQAEGIFGQRFNPGGVKVGAEFQVNTGFSGQQFSPAVAVAPDGSFLVAWEGPGTSIDVFAQRFTSTGVKIGGEFLLNTTVSGNQRYPEVQYYPDGTFVAGFVDGAQTVLQRFDVDGRTIGIETRISSASTNIVIDGLCIRPDNSVLLNWTSNGDVYGQIFDAGLQPLSAQTQLNVYTTGTQEYGTVRVDGAGNFVAVWQSNGQDGSGLGVYGRRFDRNFNALGSEFAITTNTAGDQFEPQVAIEPGGRFIITWSDKNNRDGGGGTGESIWMREYDTNGNALGSETRVNESIAGYQAYPVIDMSKAGRFVIVWEGNGTQAGNTDSYGVFARTYQLSQTGTTVMSVSSTSVTASDVVTVTMILTAPSTVTGVYPNPPSVMGTNGVFATLISGPTPTSQTVGISPVTFTWTYRVTSMDKSGTLQFGGNAYNTTGTVFPYAVCNAVSVKSSILISDLTAPNLIADANNPSISPRVFTIGARVVNLGTSDMTNVVVKIGDGITAGTFPATTMSLSQTNNTYQGTFSLTPRAGTSDCSRTLTSLGASKAVIGGAIDFNGDGIISPLDNGTLSNGKKVVAGRVDVNRDNTANANDDLPRSPGVYNGYREPAIIDGYVDTDGDGIIGAADVQTYGGETKFIYWQVVYNVVDANNTPTFGTCNDLADDLRYRWIVWVSGNDGGVARMTNIAEFARVRCSQSAATNKVLPTGNPLGYISGSIPRVIAGYVDVDGNGQISNADDGVYYGKTVIDGKIDLNGTGNVTLADDGVVAFFPVIDGLVDANGSSTITNADDGILVQPGGTFSVTVHNAAFGTVGAGYDENRDNLWDTDIWYQPIGSMNWPAASFRLIDIQSDLIGTGGNNPLNGITTHFDNEPYLSRLFDDRLGQSGGFNGTYTYTFEVISQANSYFSPYQQVASGTNNEKYNSDYGSGLNILGRIDYILPVTGLEVSATVKGFEANVKWTTESETNSSHFVVERSTDNNTFLPVSHNVKAAGNSASTLNYRFVDNMASLVNNGLIYYRIKEVSNEGKYTYSKVVTVKIDRPFEVTVSPNPFRSRVFIGIDVATHTEVGINVINAAGLTVFSIDKTAQKGRNQLEVSGLEKLFAGLYFVELVNKSNGTKSIHKLIRSN